MRYANIVVSLFCAWVLWNVATDFPTSGNHTREWVLIDGFGTVADCQSARSKALADAQIMRKAEDTEKLDIDDSSATIRRKDGSLTHWKFSCIPDTIDPRAPKAGK